MNRKFETIRAACGLLAIVMLCNTGCQSPWKTPKMFSLENSWPFRDKNAPQEGTPVRMVGTWTDTVLTQAGQKPQRGFGGRIMFYDHENKNPILVEGQLVVYAFNEDGRDPTDNKPTRRYVFPADQVPKHMSKSELGASYSFWLPWDEAGGPKTEVSLVCRFEPKGGGVVTSEQTKHVLPGPVVAASGAKQPPKLPEGVPSKPMRPTLQSIQAARMAERNAMQASYDVPVMGQPQTAIIGGQMQPTDGSERRMTATTIALPNSFQLPDAASLNLAAAAAANPQMSLHQQQQMAANLAQLQLAAAARPNLQAAPVANVQPAGFARPFAAQSLPQQMGIKSPMTAGAQSVVPGPNGWNNMAVNQLPQAQAQQPMLGQPMIGQPMLQQPAMQQPTLQQQQMIQQSLAQQPMQSQQTWPQTATQAGATTPLSYPGAAGQLVR